MLKVIIFWDYDTQWGADRSRISGGPKDWGFDEFINTEVLLDLHAKYEIPACFAVVGAAALAGKRPYHDPRQIRQIYELGHEVGSHMFKHEWIPGLGFQSLKESLIKSKDALEQCLGAEVVSFVPPYNQPFDFSSRLAFSFSERRKVIKERIDIPTMCRFLFESGYRFSRISYQTVFDQLQSHIYQSSRLNNPSRIENICGVNCLRLNSIGGFNDMEKPLRSMLSKEGYFIAYGHPHSITANNRQNKKYLIPFLALLKSLKAELKVEVVLPRDIIR